MAKGIVLQRLPHGLIDAEIRRVLKPVAVASELLLNDRGCCPQPRRLLPGPRHLLLEGVKLETAADVHFEI